MGQFGHGGGGGEGGKLSCWGGGEVSPALPPLDETLTNSCIRKN